MRIIAGLYRGRALAAPEGRIVRPTSDRAREAIFNVIEHAPWSPGLAGARAVDLFAGSGALGLEALSRGAALCLFVETDAGARGAIRANIDAVGDASLAGRTRIHRRDATDLGPMPAGDGPPFDLAFLDPPYGQGLDARALASLVGGGWLKAGALAMVERGADEAELVAEGFDILDQRRYGAAQVVFLRALQS